MLDRSGEGKACRICHRYSSYKSSYIKAPFIWGKTPHRGIYRINGCQGRPEDKLNKVAALQVSRPRGEKNIWGLEWVRDQKLHREGPNLTNPWAGSAEKLVFLARMQISPCLPGLPTDALGTWDAEEACCQAFWEGQGHRVCGRDRNNEKHSGFGEHLPGVEYGTASFFEEYLI